MTMSPLEQTILDLLRKSGYSLPRYFSKREHVRVARELCAAGLAEENPTRKGEFRITEAGEEYR